MPNRKAHDDFQGVWLIKIIAKYWLLGIYKNAPRIAYLQPLVSSL